MWIRGMNTVDASLYPVTYMTYVWQAWSPFLDLLRRETIDRMSNEVVNSDTETLASVQC